MCCVGFMATAQLHARNFSFISSDHEHSVPHDNSTPKLIINNNLNKIKNNKPHSVFFISSSVQYCQNSSDRRLERSCIDTEKDEQNNKLSKWMMCSFLIGFYFCIRNIQLTSAGKMYGYRIGIECKLNDRYNRIRSMANFSDTKLII